MGRSVLYGVCSIVEAAKLFCLFYSRDPSHQNCVLFFYFTFLVAELLIF